MAGSSAEYWDHEWATSDLASRLTDVEERPGSLERLLSSHLGRDPILEAGCGDGWAVAWLGRLGRQALGVDFAADALVRARAQGFDLDLVVGNLEHLPLATSAFGTVISLGALEHFEAGPAAGAR